MATNKALIFKKIPEGYPVPGEHLVVEPVSYDANASTPAHGVFLQSLYTSFDPYMRGHMRRPEIKSCSPSFQLNQPIESASIAKVVRSNNASYKEGADELSRIRPLDNPLGIEDIHVFVGALGMPGVTAYSSLYEIGQPKKGETIFVSAASGAVGQVGSDEKLNYVIKDLGFDDGFNYKEKPADALARLPPDGIDIYYENVGGEHMEAALDALNSFGRVVVCGLISQYNTAPYPIKSISNVLTKRLTMRGSIVSYAGIGDMYTKDHQQNVQKWIEDGSFKALTHETVGIDNAPEGLVGIFYGKNMGKAVLKF